MHAKKLKQCNKIVENKIKQKSMDYNYLQYYETLIKYVKAYNIVITMQILQTTEWTRARTTALTLYIIYIKISVNNYYGDWK